MYRGLPADEGVWGCFDDEVGARGVSRDGCGERVVVALCGTSIEGNDDEDGAEGEGVSVAGRGLGADGDKIGPAGGGVRVGMDEGAREDVVGCGATLVGFD